MTKHEFVCPYKFVIIINDSENGSSFQPAAAGTVLRMPWAEAGAADAWW
jgi:hypothetical protein